MKTSNKILIIFGSIFLVPGLYLYIDDWITLTGGQQRYFSIPTMIGAALILIGGLLFLIGLCSHYSDTSNEKTNDNQHKKINGDRP